jgi:hypothetical protein
MLAALDNSGKSIVTLDIAPFDTYTEYPLLDCVQLFHEERLRVIQLVKHTMS